MDIIIVTGASSGMGREFCKKLDNENVDEIWGIARNVSGLEETGKMLKTPFRPVSLDLTDSESVKTLDNLLKENDANIKWLINAAGFGKFGRYDEILLESELNMIDLNCKAMVAMTRVALNFMKEGSKIVQFGSVAGMQPVPYINVYASTKAFVVSYSKSLKEELKSRKISVTCVCPFWTKTAFFNRAKEINSKTDENPISKYVVMYDPEKVINKA